MTCSIELRSLIGTENEGGCGSLRWRANRDGSNTLDVTVNERITDYNTTVLTYDGLGEMTAIDHQGRSS